MDTLEQLNQISKKISDLTNLVKEREMEIDTLDAAVASLEAKCATLQQQLSTIPLPEVPYSQTLQKIHDLVWSKWTWLGTNGWKSRRDQLKDLLPF